MAAVVAWLEIVKFEIRLHGPGTKTWRALSPFKI
jgi:hypothetical protein